MDVVGHFLVTYLRSSWLYNQIASLRRYESRVYSWARNVDDDITRGDHYFQAAPNLGASRQGRIAMLGFASSWERIFNGTSRHISTRMQTDQVSVVHAHFGRAGFAAIPIVNQTKLPLVTSFYGYDVAQYGKLPKWRRNYRKLFERGDLMLCLGPNMQKDLMEMGCPKEKTRIHHLGVDIRNIEYRVRTWNVNEPLRVMIAAAFRPKKGIPYALEALGQFRREIDLQITVVGDTLDTPDSLPEKEKIIATMKAEGLKDCTTLTGFKPYPALLQEAYNHHIFMAPSITAPDGDMEGTPMALADMAATGIPIISSHHADIAELIVHGKTGLLAEEKDVEGLVQHLRWLVNHKDQWESITRQARHHIETEFDTSIQAERLETIYDAVQ
jgi:colanic acid/amylovoran biosynthesis glycosyltransferase